MTTTRKAHNSVWHILVTSAVFLLYSLTFGLLSGYSYGAGFLLLTSLGYLATRPSWDLSTEDNTLIYSFLIVSTIALTVFIIHGDQPKTLDQTSRYILLIPILLLLLNIAPRLPILWMGIVIGTMSSTAVAVWQHHGLGIPRPSGFMTSAIPFGDLSLIAGILCLAGISWAHGRCRHVQAWKIVLALGFVAGLYTSVLSGSRGGWLVIPAIFILFCFAFLKRKNLRQALICAALLVASLGVVFSILKDEVVARYNIAVVEIDNYVQHRDANTSVGLRLEAWRAAVMNIAEKPILGWSYKDYAARLEELAAEKKTSESITELSNTHNNYLEVWLHQGIFGLLALLAVYIVPFWFFCKRLRSPNIKVQALAVGGASLLVSFFIFGLTQVILGRNNGIVFFGLSLVIFWACMRNEEKKAALEDLLGTNKVQ